MYHLSHPILFAVFLYNQLESFACCYSAQQAKGTSTWWLEGVGGTPQVGGSISGLGLKESHSPIPLKTHGKVRP
jgi:hypothetical protein